MSRENYGLSRTAKQIGVLPDDGKVNFESKMENSIDALANDGQRDYTYPSASEVRNVRLHFSIGVSLGSSTASICSLTSHRKIQPRCLSSRPFSYHVDDEAIRSTYQAPSIQNNSTTHPLSVKSAPKTILVSLAKKTLTSYRAGRSNQLRNHLAPSRRARQIESHLSEHTGG